MNCRLILSVGKAFTALKWTLRRRFIDDTPMESSKVAYYTPMPHLRFLTGDLASLDVENLFTNVPVQKTIEIIIDNVYNPPTIQPPNIPKEILEE